MLRSSWFPNPFQQVVLVALRFVVGWHLFYQGLGKYLAVNWTAQGFLEAARGPFAGYYKSLAASPDLLRIADGVTVWGLMVIGLLLMLGLLTRTAAFSGFVLLLSFFLAAPPVTYMGFTIATAQGFELYVDKTLIEALALLVILAFPTGQMAGLDILITQWRRRRERYFGRD